MNRVSDCIKEKVKNFLESDENSRMTTGKGDTVTRHKDKKQKRLLTDTMKNLHTKFCTDTDVKMSYASFLRLRPFYIVSPSIKDRETCLCKLCENTTLLVQKLTQQKILRCDSLKSAASLMCCDLSKKECCYRECMLCRNRTVRDHVTVENGDHPTCWLQWVRKQEQIVDQGQVVSRWVKEKIHGTVNDLVSSLNDVMGKISVHLFNILNQYKETDSLKGRLGQNEAIVHIDFAENWVSKYGSEVQAVHFGASKTQTTLHNCVVSFAGGSTKSYCTVSDSRRHDAIAIWDYLWPVLEELRILGINTIHFQSDGPTTQYRNKVNMLLFCTVPF